MQRKLGLLAGILLVMSFAGGAPRATAQGVAGVSGVVTDPKGKPLPEVVVVLKSKDTGGVYTLKTDKNGAFKQIGLRTGAYDMSVKQKDSDQVLVEGLICRITSEADTHCDVDMRKLGLSPEEQAARQKQEEDQKKFQGMKASFDAGQAKTEEADKARADMLKAPADQRAALQPAVNSLYSEALDDFTKAQQSAPEKDTNMHLVYYKQGYVNEMMGKYDAAIAAYQKAVDLKPTSADYTNSLALALAKGNRTPEAIQACEKSATLDPAKAAQCWWNLGVVLYNANRLPEAVEPLQKSTALNPNNAQAWYLLGASLVATMTVKQQGDKMIPVLAPGTVEAYQKCIALDPNGPWGAQAKQGLEQLQAMGAGVDTKVRVKKP